MTQDLIVPARALPNLSMRDAKKEIGLGYSPDAWGKNCDTALADQCNPTSRIVVAEVARWRTDLPVPDSSIPSAYGDRINVWGTPDGQPPSGVTTATNTNGTPGLFATDMIIRGISIRVLVEPEARLIRGGYFNPAGLANVPGMPDVWTQIDSTNNILGVADGQSQPQFAEVLFGMSTWKAAYAFINAYELVVGKTHQDRLIQEPLTQVAHIEPFAEAEAAGMVFGSNQDRAYELNQRLIQLGVPEQFVPTMFKRLGNVTVTSGESTIEGVSNVTPSREEDGSITMFGGIGVPQNMLQHDPYMFTTPIFWPAGHPIQIFFSVNDQAYQAQFQRWLSLTGGTGGNTGRDLNLPFSQAIADASGYNGLMPSTVTDGVTMPEQSLDVTTPPVLVSEQVQANRVILKQGAMVFEVAVIGFRCGQAAWHPIVANAIKRGAILAPNGYGALGHYMKN